MGQPPQRPYGNPYWPPPPMWRPPAYPPPPRPPISGTANAALVIAVLSIPAGLFPLMWIIPAGLVVGIWAIPLIIIGLVGLPQVLGYLTLREIRQGRANPISRQRAVLAMGISGMYLLLALCFFVAWLTGT